MSRPFRQLRDDAADGGDARLEVDHAEQGLQRGGEDRLARAAPGLVFPAAEADQRPEAEIGGPPREVSARHQLGAPWREDADGSGGGAGEDMPAAAGPEAA